jgi:hypothetical protein
MKQARLDVASLTGIGHLKTGKKLFERTKQASSWAIDAVQFGSDVLQERTWI